MALLRARRRADTRDASIVAYTRLSHLDSKGDDAVRGRAPAPVNLALLLPCCVPITPL
jgi:hypothetical protein